MKISTLSGTLSVEEHDVKWGYLYKSVSSELPTSLSYYVLVKVCHTS